MKNLFCFSIAVILFVSCTGNPDSVQKPENENGSKKSLTFDNAVFYDENGAFIEESAKDAIIALAEYHGYQVFPQFRERLWVSDYGTGRFVELGLAACMFMNNETDRYMLMDLFLLPGQMLPEHWHLDGETNPAKLEGWLVRNGKSYIVGVGEDNLSNFAAIKIPDCHMNGEAETKHVIEAMPGSFTP